MLILIAALAGLAAAAEPTAGSLLPEALKPLGVAVSDQNPYRDDDDAPIEQLPTLSVKATLTVSDPEAALDAVQDILTKAGGRSLQVLAGGSVAGFLFSPAPVVEQRGRVNKALDAIAHVGAMRGYKEEFLPALEQRTAEASMSRQMLEDERARLAKALKAAPRAAKVIDAEIARLSRFKADEEPRQAVLTISFEREDSAPPKVQKLKDEHQHGGEEKQP